MATSKVPRVNHETLAEMIGTTRPHVTYFMNKFRIEYDHEKIVIKAELLADRVLND
jgi:hypothetical protein